MMGKAALGALVAIAGLIALLLAGCGGGEMGESTSKADFIRQGNAICGKWQQARGEALRGVRSKLQPPVTPAKQEKVILVILKPYGEAIEGLDDLEPPAGKEAQVNAMIKALKIAFKEAETDPAALIHNSTIFKKSNDMVKAYGLSECTV